MNQHGCAVEDTGAVRNLVGVRLREAEGGWGLQTSGVLKIFVKYVCKSDDCRT